MRFLGLPPDHASEFYILSEHVLPGETYSAYSYTAPEGVGGLAFVGGWATAADVGPDVLYSTPAGTVEPTPLAFVNAPPYPAHQNDPTVVEVGDVYEMFYTSLPNSATALGQITTENQVGLITATDPYGPWTYRGIVVADGWSPSALADGSGVTLYYNTGGAHFADFFSRMSPDGTHVLSTEPMLYEGGPMQMTNLSVIRQGAELLAVGNWMGDLTEVGAVYSVDGGRDWYPVVPWRPVVVSGGAQEYLTPEVSATGHPGVYTLTVTTPRGPGNTDTVTVEWTVSFTGAPHPLPRRLQE